MSTILPDLERDLLRAAKREARARKRAERGRRRWWSPRPFVILITIGLVGGTAALAGSGLIDFGNPDPPNLHPETYGRVIPKSAATVPIVVPDPDGGLAWGMRVFETAGQSVGGFRPGKVTCIQIGRLYEGQVGVLGEDGAFGDDGRFHISGLQSQDCGPQDANGHAVFGAGELEPRPASGQISRTSCLDARFGTPDQTGHPVCKPGRWRTIMGGLAGPEAETVTLNARSGPITQTVPPNTDGAYLFVLKGDPSETVVGEAPYVTITYRDGTVCPQDGRAKCSVPPGIVPPRSQDRRRPQ